MCVRQTEMCVMGDDTWNAGIFYEADFFLSANTGCNLTTKKKECKVTFQPFDTL